MEYLTLDILKDMVRNRLVIRASNKHTSNDSFQILILTQAEILNEEVLIELSYIAPKQYISTDPELISLKCHNAEDRDKYLATSLRNWENYYGDRGGPLHRVKWTDSREVVIEGNQPSDQLNDIPPYNAFFLQELVRIEMWLYLAMEHKGICNKSSEVLKTLKGRLSAFIQEKNKLLSGSYILVPVR